MSEEVKRLVQSLQMEGIEFPKEIELSNVKNILEHGWERCVEPVYEGYLRVGAFIGPRTFFAKFRMMDGSEESIRLREQKRTIYQAV